MQSVVEIINQVKRRANIPDNQVDATTMLTFVQAALDEIVYPELFAWNEEFFLISEVLTPTGNYLSYPVRAYGRNLRELKDVSTSPNRVNLPRIDLEEMQSDDYGFYIKGDDIIFTNPPALVEVTYAVATPTLLNTSIAGVVSSVSNSSIVVSSGHGLTNGNQFIDLYKKSSGTYLKINISASLTTNTFTVSLTAAEAARFAALIGTSSDLLVVPSNQNYYTPIPKEADNMLVYGTISRYLESQGDTEGLSINELKIADAKRVCRKALSKRVTGEPKIIGTSKGVLNYMNRFSTRM